MCASAACTRRSNDWRQGGERTENMLFMSVTLEVSKLSGWLNADAPCQVARKACAAG